MTRNLAKTKVSIVFTVTSVTSSVGAYRPADNHDPKADSNGTKITVTRPASAQARRARLALRRSSS